MKEKTIHDASNYKMEDVKLGDIFFGGDSVECAIGLKKGFASENINTSTISIYQLNGLNEEKVSVYLSKEEIIAIYNKFCK